MSQKLLTWIWVAIVVAGHAAQSSCAEHLDHAEINWHSDASKAVKVARENDRPVLIYVTAANCGHCRKMERQTWTDTQVVKAVDDYYVAIKLTPERHPNLLRQLNVQAFPTTLLLNSQLKYKAGAVGWQSPHEMNELLLGSTSPVRTVQFKP